MTFRALNLCLPLVLAVHSVEEYLPCGAFLKGAPAAMQKLVTRSVFRNALLF